MTVLGSFRRSAATRGSWRPTWPATKSWEAPARKACTIRHHCLPVLRTAPWRPSCRPPFLETQEPPNVDLHPHRNPTPPRRPRLPHLSTPPILVDIRCEFCPSLKSMPPSRLRYVAQFASQSEGRATSWNAGRCPSRASSPANTSIGLGRSRAGFCRNGPTPVECGKHRAKAAQVFGKGDHRPKLGRCGDTRGRPHLRPEILCSASAKLAPKSAKIVANSNLTNIGPSSVSFDRSPTNNIGPESTEIGR